MKRTIVYDVEQKKPRITPMHSQKIRELQNKSNSKEKERKSRALRTIHNAGVLGEIVKSIGDLKLNDPNAEAPVIKEAIEKISKIVEEMKLDFKKDYWE